MTCSFFVLHAYDIIKLNYMYSSITVIWWTLMKIIPYHNVSYNIIVRSLCLSHKIKCELDPINILNSSRIGFLVGKVQREGVSVKTFRHGRRNKPTLSIANVENIFHQPGCLVLRHPILLMIFSINPCNSAVSLCVCSAYAQSHSAYAQCTTNNFISYFKNLDYTEPTPTFAPRMLSDRYVLFRVGMLSLRCVSFRVCSA